MLAPFMHHGFDPKVMHRLELQAALQQWQQQLCQQHQWYCTVTGSKQLCMFIYAVLNIQAHLQLLADHVQLTPH